MCPEPVERHESGSYVSWQSKGTKQEAMCPEPVEGHEAGSYAP
jgi:hypothetical protein